MTPQGDVVTGNRPLAHSKNDRKEVTMSIVSPPDRLAGTSTFSTVHYLPVGGRAPSDDVELAAELEFIQAA